MYAFDVFKAIFQKSLLSALRITLELYGKSLEFENSFKFPSEFEYQKSLKTRKTQISPLILALELRKRGWNESHPEVILSLSNLGLKT